eukprot:CAMPEP_0119273008 /NCGR_PEP_ID=MMETSP1329-20130426/9457_1 /TAXON_ID=114041 /ORGANISM="Genus nov. species nov., Strain RCC1024" /LENGTH=134 /DNA_ID=CAMNT_0007273167 /DNA_START=272 /DNA_END=672 /DNA_ORIENTATION=-
MSCSPGIDGIVAFFDVLDRRAPRVNNGCALGPRRASGATCGPLETLSVDGRATIRRNSRRRWRTKIQRKTRATHLSNTGFASQPRWTPWPDTLAQRAVRGDDSVSAFTNLKQPCSARSQDAFSPSARVGQPLQP